MLWNLITDQPSDSHPICPRHATYLFPASDCIKFVLFLTLLEKTCLADARHTLVAAGSQKHFIYVWMAVGAQFCLAQTVCCGLWHLFASILSPWHTLSLSPLGLCSILCVRMHLHVFGTMHEMLCTRVYMFFELQLRFFFYPKYHVKETAGILYMNFSLTLLSVLFPPEMTTSSSN